MTDQTAKAKDVCYRLLAARPRTRDELRKALARKGIDAEVADEVLGKFDKAGLIDDAQFAETWVRSRQTYQGLGKRALKSELLRKGVDRQIVEDTIEEVDPEAEEGRARALVCKRLRALSGVDEVTAVRRLVNMLARKGYSEGMAYRVVREELSAVGREATVLDDVTAN